MLHDRRDIGFFTVADRVCFALECMVQEAIDQDRAVGRNAYGSVHVADEVLVVVDHFHTASAKHVGRTHHDGVADAMRDRESVIYRNGHVGFRHGNAQLVHHGAETVTVFGEVDDLGAGAQDVHARSLELSREVQRRLAAELRDHTERFLFLIDREHIFGGERLEVELVGGVVVC